MFEIKKVYRQTIPATRFIRKKYSDSDRENGSFAHKWQEWFAKGHFATLEKLLPQGAFFEDSGAYIGLRGGKNKNLLLMLYQRIPRYPKVLTMSIFRKCAWRCLAFRKEENPYCHEDAVTIL